MFFLDLTYIFYPKMYTFRSLWVTSHEINNFEHEKHEVMSENHILGIVPP